MNQTNDKKINFPGTDDPGLHPRIKASLYPNNTAGDEGPNLQGPENWAELVDSCIYPRIKFRERYMETPEAPYR